MGADTFIVKATGGSAKDAFDGAVDQAYYDYGHQGYTGSIAEKDSFVMIPLPEDIDPEVYADMLFDQCDDRIDDKWGPAGCFQLSETEFMFFGWASS